MDASGIGGDASGSGIKAQVYDASGGAVGGEFLVNTVTANYQYAPTITGLTNGGFVVSWMDYSGIGGDASSSGIKAQVYDASGGAVGGEFLVNTVTASNQLYPTITGLTNGGFVVSWMDYSGIGGDASGWGIKAQVYSASGDAVGSEFLVNTVTASDQIYPTITGLTNGGFVVSWDDYSGIGGDTSDYGIKAQVYSASGGAVGGEFLVNSTTDNNQFSSTITGLTNGGFIVSWMDASGIGGDGSYYGIKAQVYDASGGAVGGEFLVNTVTASDQLYPTITGLTNGGFVVSWMDLSGIGGDATGSGIKAQIYAPTGDTITGTNGNDVLTGTAYDDTIYTLLGSDIVDGKQGSDALIVDHAPVAIADANDPTTYRFVSDIFVDSDGLSGAIDENTRHRVDFARVESLDVTLGSYRDYVNISGPSERFGDVRIDGAGGEDTVNFNLLDNATFADGTDIAGYGTFLNFEHHSVSIAQGTNTVTMGATDDYIGSSGGIDMIDGGAGSDAWEADFTAMTGPLTVTVTGTAATASNGTTVTNVEQFDVFGSLGDSHYAADGRSAVYFHALPTSSSDLNINDAGILGVGINGTGNRNDIGTQDGAFYGTVATAQGRTSFDGVRTLSIIGSDDDNLYRISNNDGTDPATLSLTIDGGIGSDTVKLFGDRAGFAITAASGGYDIVDTFIDDGTQPTVHVKSIEHVQFNDQILDLTGGITVTGTAANDVLTGTAFDDILIGLGGNDNLTGGTGNDVLNGGAGNDILNGGLGIDTATFADSAKGVQVNLALTAAQFTGDGKDTLIGIENLIGSAFADGLRGDGNANILDGALGNDNLFGFGGADTLIGGDGNDRLDGGDAADILRGGLGRDVLIGGAGADTFVFDSFTGAPQPDTITDFTAGTDHIAIAKAIFTAFAADPLGALSASEFHIGTRALTPDQHIVYNAATGALFYDADGSGTGAQIAIAALTGHPAINAGDFLLA